MASPITSIVVPDHFAKIGIRIVTDDAELAMLADHDRENFGPYQCADFDEYRRIADNGFVVSRYDTDGTLIGAAQLLTSKIDGYPLLANEAYCYGSFVTKAYRSPLGRGFSLALHRAQEALARLHGLTLMTLTVRADNTASVCARLRQGYRIVGYVAARYDDLDRGGARLVMQRRLDVDGVAIDDDAALALWNAGHIQTVDTATDWSPDRPLPAQISVRAAAIPEIEEDPPPDLELTRLVHTVIDAGYEGIGQFEPPDSGGRRHIVFQQTHPVPLAVPPASPSVHDEFSRLTDVIVNHGSWVSQITEEDAINDTAESNVGKIDELAAVDEHRGFVDALVAAGVSIHRTGAQGRNGRFAIFSRDPSFVIGNTAIVGSLKNHKRRPESPPISHLLRATDRRDARERFGAFIEGGDVVLLGDGHVAVGVGQRTSDAGADWLVEQFPDLDVIKVVHEKLHLDVIFTVVGRHLALAHRPSLSPEFLSVLGSLGFDVIDCDDAEAETLGCNVLAIDDRRVIASDENVRTNTALAAHGVDVIALPMRNLTMRGGGPRCMTCPVSRDGD